MKLLRNLAFILMLSKVVIFASLFASEFSEPDLELDIESKKRKTTSMSCCFSDMASDLLVRTTKDAFFMLYRPELSQLFIVLRANKETKYICWDVSHLITNPHVLPEEKGKFAISRKATQNLSRYLEDADADSIAKPAGNFLPQLSITIPADCMPPRNRKRVTSNDWCVGFSAPTTPTDGWSSPLIAH